MSVLKSPLWLTVHLRSAVCGSLNHFLDVWMETSPDVQVFVIYELFISISFSLFSPQMFGRFLMWP